MQYGDLLYDVALTRGLASFAACMTAAASGLTSSKAATDAKPNVLAALARIPVGANPAFCTDSKHNWL